MHVAITSTQDETIYLFGSLERVFPDPFVIKLLRVDPASPGIHLNPNETKFLTNKDLEDAFGNFNPDDLSVSGSINSLDYLKEGPNYKLLEGNYKICFTAKSKSTGQDVSIESCAFLNICHVTVPQF